MNAFAMFLWLLIRIFQCFWLIWNSALMKYADNNIIMISEKLIATYYLILSSVDKQFNTLLFHFCIKIDGKKLIHDLEIWNIKQRFIYKWWKVLWFECHYREDLLDINLILPRVSFFPFFKPYDLSQRAVASKGFTLFA